MGPTCGAHASAAAGGGSAGARGARPLRGWAAAHSGAAGERRGRWAEGRPAQGEGKSFFFFSFIFFFKTDFSYLFLSSNKIIQAQANKSNKINAAA